ncbi:MAG: DUF4115 domain-containing protein [Desulfobacterales bacterium]|nr:DUF4115 domain-containing protein [Desulfobacterales bacterium]
MIEHKVKQNRDIDYDAMSFGRYLKALRLEKGISIKRVSFETRIKPDMLNAIETEDHDKLPDPVFVKGFLKAYATLIGANPDETVQRYLANCHLHIQTARYEADLIRSRKRLWLRLTVSLGALACLIFFSVWLTSAPDTIKKEAPPIAPAIATPAREKAPVIAPETPEPKQPAPVTATNTLVIAGVKETWVKLIIDEQTPKKYTINAGDRLEFTAEHGINLLIGNATGVNLIFNHKPFPIHGKPGQMVTLRLP